LPEPCKSVTVGQLASGLAVALPAAVRHAVLPLTAGAVGRDTDPAVPSTVLSWNGWLNRTMPAASAFGACTATPAVTMLVSSITAAARDTIRRARRAPAWPPVSADSPFLRPGNGGNAAWVTTTPNGIARATASGGIAVDVTLDGGHLAKCLYCHRNPSATGCELRCDSRR